MPPVELGHLDTIARRILQPCRAPNAKLFEKPFDLLFFSGLKRLSQLEGAAVTFRALKDSATPSHRKKNSHLVELAAQVPGFEDTPRDVLLRLLHLGGQLGEVPDVNTLQYLYMETIKYVEEHLSSLLFWALIDLRQKQPNQHQIVKKVMRIAAERIVEEMQSIFELKYTEYWTRTVVACLVDVAPSSGASDTIISAQSAASGGAVDPNQMFERYFENFRYPPGRVAKRRLESDFQSESPPKRSRANEATTSDTFPDDNRPLSLCPYDDVCD
eukprot:TRINITY_DN2639_c0_g2_i11.p1 TRINITY_DN2639_c0_g2~~TRINITY_DN2639_c0_g2_i11.p1  ORF type:complete len:272 (-),score=53.11 TRINITY_DN2639_c0_g2_i11:27-842(-)